MISSSGFLFFSSHEYEVYDRDELSTTQVLRVYAATAFYLLTAWRFNMFTSFLVAHPSPGKLETLILAIVGVGIPLGVWLSRRKNCRSR